MERALLDMEVKVIKMMIRGRDRLPKRSIGPANIIFFPFRGK